MHPSPNPIPPAAACDHAGAERASAGGDTPPAESQPRPVTRGESSPFLAHIDWFACTFVPAGQGLAVVESVFLIPRSEWKERAGGWQGYTTRIDLAGLGILAYGGEHQRGTAHVELSGSGCALIKDWNAVRVWCEAYGVRLTRIDLAHDDFGGETVSIPSALDWLARGEFNAGGRAPRARLIDDLGSGKGKTLNVGQRQHGKMCRVYEKGKQLGDPASPWCRVEVEFRGKSRELPYDLLVRPSEYLAGAYPCLAYLSQRQDKVRTLRKTSEISYARLVECLRTQYGPALSTMLRVEGGDLFAVLEQASRPGTPKRLENLPLPSGRSNEGRVL